MINYKVILNPALLAWGRSNGSAAFYGEIQATLIDLWIRDYAEVAPDYDILETPVSGFSYLFDLRFERLLAAWGISRGKNTESREEVDKRMRPLTMPGSHFHRGHAIAHTLGGAADINIVPQLGEVNIGAFRKIERRAVSSPGALYFTYWRYAGDGTQVPFEVEQGLLCPGQTAIDWALHRNR